MIFVRPCRHRQLASMNVTVLISKISSGNPKVCASSQGDASQGRCPPRLSRAGCQDRSQPGAQEGQGFCKVPGGICREQVGATR